MAGYLWDKEAEGLRSESEKKKKEVSLTWSLGHKISTKEQLDPKPSFQCVVFFIYNFL